MQRFLQVTRMNVALYVLFIGGLLHTVFVLAEHNGIWAVPPPTGAELPPPPTLIGHSENARYVASVQISAVLSLLGVPAWIAALIWARRQSSDLTPPSAGDALP